MFPMISPFSMWEKLIHYKAAPATKLRETEDPLIKLQRDAEKLVRTARAAAAKNKKAYLQQQKALAKQGRIAEGETQNLKKQAYKDLKRRNERDRQILKDIDEDWEWSSNGSRTAREFLRDKFKTTFERDPAAPKRTFSNSGCSLQNDVQGWQRAMWNWENGIEDADDADDEGGWSN